MDAEPDVGGQNPSSVWINVDLPAPFGPNSPMVRPRSDPRRSCRISRLPNRTVSPFSSMTASCSARTACIDLLWTFQDAHGCRRHGIAGGQGNQCLQASLQEVAPAAYLYAIGLAVHIN